MLIASGPSPFWARYPTISCNTAISASGAVTFGVAASRAL
ncbi:hypothetical protein ACVWZZ_001753 [Bradyrhizobium sp. LM6.10]